MMRGTVRPLLVAVVAGAAVGLFSFLGDGRFGGRALVLVGNLAAPWALVAFFVGRLTHAGRRGAVAGTTALAIGVASYYLLGALAGYVLGAGNLVWIVVALVVGPVMGASGAVAAAGGGKALVAAAAPSAALLGEATFVAVDRAAWTWDLHREPQRLVDLAVVVGLVAIASGLPALLVRRRRDLRVVYPLALGGGLAVAAGLAGLYAVLGSVRG